MDTIKTTIEIGGITMTHPGSAGLIEVSRNPGCSVMYNCDCKESAFVASDFSKPFYIECKDDPTKLHKFCEMKYLGLVDNPHYKGTFDMIREMIKKFDGCLVYTDDGGSTLITKKHFIRLGCSRGVREVFGHTFTEIKAPCGSGIIGVSFNRIDASKPEPRAWSYASSYDKDISAMCEQLEDLDP